MKIYSLFDTTICILQRRLFHPVELVILHQRRKKIEDTQQLLCDPIS